MKRSDQKNKIKQWQQLISGFQRAFFLSQSLLLAD